MPSIKDFGGLAQLKVQFQSVAATVFLATVLSCLPSCRGRVSSLWVLGDDYVDLGTGAYVPLGRECAISPFGQNQKAATGRCSNGKILTDQLAQQMGTVIGPYSGPEAFQANGVSFAAAGGGVLEETNAGETVSLSTQMGQFQKYLTEKKFLNMLNHSLVLISFGMNDYLDAVFAGKDPMALVDTVVLKIADTVSQIQKFSGAYRFVVLGVPPLGCLPLVRKKFHAPPDSETCLTNLNAVNEAHEHRLNLALDNLAKVMPNGAPIYFSSFSLSYAFMDQSIGFPAFSKKLEVACGLVGDDGKTYNCGQNVTYVDQGQTMVAPVVAPKMSGYDYFWWDWLNPTENACYSLWVAMWMGTNPKAVYPMSVLKLTFT